MVESKGKTEVKQQQQQQQDQFWVLLVLAPEKQQLVYNSAVPRPCQSWLCDSRYHYPPKSQLSFAAQNYSVKLGKLVKIEIIENTSISLLSNFPPQNISFNDFLPRVSLLVTSLPRVSLTAKWPA